MEGFMDDLSEDWISQPRSSSASTSPSQLHGSWRKNVLSERSQNDGNIMADSVQRQRKGLSRRSLSDASSEALGRFDTTARKSVSVSPPKSRQNNTPEWRRRLLHGDLGYGEQKDLFGPMGIENIFQKPAPRGSMRRVQQDKPRGLSFLKGLQAIASSPPPWPSNEEPALEATSKFDTINGRQLHALDEEEEEETMQSREVEDFTINAEEADQQSEISNNSSQSQSERRSNSDGSVVHRGVSDILHRTSLDSLRLKPTSRNISNASTWRSSQHSDDFSPVFISKHNTTDGRIAYAPLDMTRSELNQQIRQMNASLPSQTSSVSDANVRSIESSLARIESENLPEDLPVGTPDVGTPDLASIGEFVSVKRGGYSELGSFKRRPLSPSPLSRPLSASTNETSIPFRGSTNLEGSLTSTAALAIPVADPATPRTDRTGKLLSPERAKSSNSPLKLFGNHDTYTSARLQRRISQLEEPGVELAVEKGSLSRKATGDLSALEEELSSIQRDGEPRRNDHTDVNSLHQHFGGGNLNAHAFPDEQWSLLEDSKLSNSLPSRSPSPDLFPPGYHQPFRFHVEAPPPDVFDTFKSKRKSSKGSGIGGLSVSKRSDRTRPRLSVMTNERVTSQPSQLSQISQASQVSEGKRPLTPSPLKSPTPKRRRTLHHSELQVETQEQRVASTYNSHDHFQNALGRKRKDARHGSARNLANPDVLAQRDILRPRNPTPSQRRRWDAEQAVLQANLDGSSSPRLTAIQEHLSAPPMPGESINHLQARAIASDLASFSEDVAQRKKSITTQDYLDEAMKLMSYLRSNRRPNSNLTSVHEQESEQTLSELVEEARLQHGLTLERPPTREGRPSGWRSRGNESLDPQVVNHLRKFQDTLDDDQLENASLSDDSVHHHVTRAVKPIDMVTSDPPGIQIFAQSAENESRSRSRSDSSPTRNAEKSVGTNGTNDTRVTHSSRTSMDSTMGRTTTSKISENVATLAPDLVSHLIPEKVAGMTFDKVLGKWVKARSPEKEKPIFELSGMMGSDNDPFDDIPDLTVDSDEETKNLMLGKAGRLPPIGVAPESPTGLDSGFDPLHSSWNSPDIDNALSAASSHQGIDKPQPREQSPPVRQLLHLEAGSQPAPNSTEPLANEEEEEDGEDEESVEHEISIHESRHQPIRFVPSTRDSPGWYRSRKTLSPVLETSGISARDYAARPVQATPRIQRPEARQMSLSVRVTGVMSTKKEHNDIIQLQDTPCKSEVTFYLSELPDFTLDQIDERDLPVRILSRHNTVASRIQSSEDRYASGNHLLVKALQDAHPGETYWEDLRRINISGQGLSSLHLLDVLCDRLEKLDVSRNMLSQIIGAPSTIRSLSLQGNKLTSLTSWSHLTNLQYLDVSNNQIGSLEGFASLVHLRELRADGNNIQNLVGIEGLDGLLSLSLRSNKLVEVDFRSFELHRLESLDLGNNKLKSVRGLHELSRLSRLSLDQNQIATFPQDPNSMAQLKHLDLSYNMLEEVDLMMFSPRIEKLDLDNNRLATTIGLKELEQLQRLSMRSQTPVAGSCDFAPLLSASMAELTELYLSENHIDALAIPRDWYSLRTLEIASCGIQELPSDFGQSVPNLHSLNLNFNALKDLRPLLNNRSLVTLHIAGNRLARLRKTTVTLSKLRQLKVLDLRNNPFSIGFRPEAAETRLVSTLRGLLDEKGGDSVGDAGSNSGEFEPLKFLLPLGDVDMDAQYYSRLDEGTKLRRRVYEMLLASSCHELRNLDGVTIKWSDVMAKDEIWHRLVHLGVLKKSGQVVND